jgi:hypothetical protein
MTLTASPTSSADHSLTLGRRQYAGLKSVGARHRACRANLHGYRDERLRLASGWWGVVSSDHTKSNGGVDLRLAPPVRYRFRSVGHRSTAKTCTRRSCTRVEQVVELGSGDRNESRCLHEGRADRYLRLPPVALRCVDTSRNTGSSSGRPRTGRPRRLSAGRAIGPVRFIDRSTSHRVGAVVGNCCPAIPRRPCSLRSGPSSS